VLKVAQLELDASVEFEPLPLLVDEMMNPDRDVRGHFISMVFKCRLIGELDPKRRADSIATAENGHWTWVSSMPTNMIKQQLRFESLFNE
jgi:colanic acid biosynthesis protein WcaH